MMNELDLSPRDVRPKVIDNFFSRGNGESSIKALTRFIINQNPRPKDLKRVDNVLEDKAASIKDALTKVKTESE